MNDVNSEDAPVSQLTSEDYAAATRQWEEAFGSADSPEVSQLAAELEQLSAETLKDARARLIEVEQCTTCGQSHKVICHRFIGNAGRFTHWARCPDTGDVLQFAIYDNDSFSTAAAALFSAMELKFITCHSLDELKAACHDVLDRFEHRLPEQFDTT